MNIQKRKNTDTASKEREREREVDVSIDVEELQNAIIKKLACLPSVHPERCIFKLPHKLRKIKAVAYTPKTVSIGPLHHGKRNLKAMEEHKLRYLKNFLQRTESKVSLRDYLEVIKGLEERVRRSYAETINFSSDKLAEMMLVDGAFIIELFYLDQKLRKSDQNNPMSTKARMNADQNDPVFSKPWKIDDVQADLKLLENQLPYFVLDVLFKLNFGPDQNSCGDLLTLTHEFFRCPLEIDEVKNVICQSKTEVKHLVDFLRFSYMTSTPEESRGATEFQIPPSATELDDAGVELKRGESKCLLDIKFTNGVLEIPHLALDDKTEPLLRNLIALEQCCYQSDSYVIDYVTFMDGLINTPADVALLVQNGIIENWLGDSSAAAALFNKLTTETIMWDWNFYFSPVSEKLNAYCGTPWHKWKAIFKREYLSTPWKVISLVVAVILLILTLIQTVCSIKSVPHN